MSRTGVILLGFGGPDCMDAVGPFMCNLMGSKPSDELITRVSRRYLTIGGKSPLADIAQAMASKLEAFLTEAGHEIPVRIGMRYWHPYIGATIDELASLGCDRLITVSLSPFESRVAQGAYREAIAEAKERHPGIEIIETPLISTLDEYSEFFAMSAAAALEQLDQSDSAILVFTAHSLPKSDLSDDDPYVKGLATVAQAVALRLGLEPGVPGAGKPILPNFQAFGSTLPPRAWYLVYQSRGQRPGAWLEPDIEALITQAAESPVGAIIVIPIGFATDHMETLYDLDVVAADQALLADIEFVRAAVPNDDDGLLRAVSASVAALL
ncbi:MAG: ferrochelatase [Coriobacteriia bacterium]|nr:ferrochelatase [Coriobacteriia bacterium]